MVNSVQVPEYVSLAGDVAREAHEGQFRRDGVTPYVRHPESVVSRVAGDPIAEAAAWLHDVVEDTTMSVEDLRVKGIPEVVIDVVKKLTYYEGVAYEDYLRVIKEDPIARKVKIADMLTNLSERPTEKQIVKYAKGLLFLLS